MANPASARGALLLAWACAVPALGAPRVVRAPGPQLLGEALAVPIEVSARDVPKAFATSGALTGPVQQAGGIYRFTWSPPPVTYPHTAVVLIWEGGAPDATAVRIPLVGRTVLTVNTEPRAQVRVEVANKIFGPLAADNEGVAQVPIEVPPGVLQARVLANANTRHTERVAALTVPAQEPLVVAFDGSTEPRLLVTHLEKPLDPAGVRVRVEGGQASLLSAGDPLVYRVAPGRGAQLLRAVVSVNGAAREVELSLPAEEPTPAKRPTRWSVTAAAGAFHGGGLSRGPAGLVAVGQGLSLRGLELRLDLALGWQAMAARFSLADGRPLRSSVSTGRLELAGALMLTRAGRWALWARAGGGVAVYTHVVRSEAQLSVSEQGAVPQAFAALALAYRLGQLELFGEVRAAFAPVTTPRLVANVGGAVALLGLRWELP